MHCHSKSACRVTRDCSRERRINRQRVLPDGDVKKRRVSLFTSGTSTLTRSLSYRANEIEPGSLIKYKKYRCRGQAVMNFLTKRPSTFPALSRLECNWLNAEAPLHCSFITIYRSYFCTTKPGYHSYLTYLHNLMQSAEDHFTKYCESLLRFINDLL